MQGRQLPQEIQHWKDILCLRLYDKSSILFKFITLWWCSLLQKEDGQAVGRIVDSQWNIEIFAGVAQLVEQLIRNQQVRSSSLLTSSKVPE